MGNEQSQGGHGESHGKKDKPGCGDFQLGGLEKEIENLFSICEAKKAHQHRHHHDATMTTKQANRLLRKYAEEGKLKYAEAQLRSHWHLIEVMDSDEHGNTALHLAAANGHILVCRALVKAGAFLKANKKGKNAAQLAHDNKHQDCYVFLHRFEEDNEEGLSSARSQATTARSVATTLKAEDLLSKGQAVSGFDMYAQEIKRVPSDPHEIKRAATDGQALEPERRRRFSVEGMLGGGFERAATDGKVTRRGFSHNRAGSPDRGGSPVRGNPTTRGGFGRAASCPDDATRSDEEQAAHSEDPDESFKAVALFNFTADVNPPFPPDRTREFSFAKGDHFVVLEVRPDGYLLARRPFGHRRGWIPGNYLSVDGRKPFFQGETRAADQELQRDASQQDCLASGCRTEVGGTGS